MTTKSASRRPRALVITCLPVVIWGFLAGASSGGDAEDLLAQARQAINAGDRVGAWKAIDLARSNYPEAEASALAVLQSLDAICTPEQKVGRVSVATWPDGKQAAVSLTFDDALPSGYRKAAPDLEQRGWLGTYFLTNFNLKTQDKAPWNALASRGHEIGCHTVTHPNSGLPTSPPATIQFELNCGQFVTPLVTSGPILTFAYPDSLAGTQTGPLRTAVRGRYLAARSGKAGDGNQVSNASPAETDVLVSFPIMTATKTAECEQELDGAVASRGWLICMIHSVIENDGWQNITQQDWDALLALLESEEDKVWIAPLADVAGYVQSRRTAWTLWDWDGMDQVSVSVWSALDRTPPDLALTVTVRVPESWNEVTISSDDDNHTVQNGEVTFALKPDGRQIILKRFQRTGPVRP